MGLVFCFYSGYNSTEAFNDRRLLDIARLVPCNGPQSGENISQTQDDSSLPILNTAVCDPETPVTSDDNSTVDDVVVPVDDRSVLTDLKVAVSLPASLADGLSLGKTVAEAEGLPLTKTVTEAVGLPLAKTVAEAEPVLPKLETPADQLRQNPSRVTPQALQALETLLGVCEFKFYFRVCFFDITVLVFRSR